MSVARALGASALFLGGAAVGAAGIFFVIGVFVWLYYLTGLFALLRQRWVPYLLGIAVMALATGPSFRRDWPFFGVGLATGTVLGFLWLIF